MTVSFREQLNSLFRWHSVALKLKHAVKYGNEKNWTSFAPSKFVYSFFVFNGLYSIDWKKSVETDELIEWEIHLKGGDFAKIQEMKNFIGEDKFNDSLAKYIEKYLKMLGMNVENAREHLENVSSSSQIVEKMVNRFTSYDLIASFDNVMKGQDFCESLGQILFFVFHVRNNVFHGTKKLLPRTSDSQNKRLKVYTAVLLAVNDLLFEVVEQTTDWDRPSFQGPR